MEENQVANFDEKTFCHQTFLYVVQVPYDS